MIHIKDLKEEDKGRLVIYHRPGVTEEGVIVKWNNTYVFVRYGSSIHAKATYPSDLTFAHESKQEAPMMGMSY